MADDIPPAPQMNFSRYHWLAFTIAPWLLLSFLLWQSAVNAPRLDDFNDIFNWHATRWLPAHGWRESLIALFSDYQSHRYAVIKLPLIITERINFAYYSYASSLYLLLLIAGIYQTFKNHSYVWPITAVASWCFCNLQIWPMALWAPLGSALILMPMLALWSAYFLFQSRYWLMGLLLAGLNCFTHTGGVVMLLAFISAAVLLSYWQSFPWRRTIIISCYCAVILVLYFVIFPANSGSGNHSASISTLAASASQALWQLIANTLRVFGSFLLFNQINNDKALLLSLVIGAIECGLAIWLILRWRLAQLPAIWVWAMGLALVALSIAAGRGLTIGPEQTLQGHYKLLSNIGLWLGLCSILLLSESAKSATLWRNSIIAFAVLSYIAGIATQYQAMKTLQRDLLQDVCQWQARYEEQGQAALKHSYSVLFIKQPNKKLKAAYDSGFYRPNCDD